MSPKGAARDFYAAKYNDEVIAALRKKGVDSNKAEIASKSIVIADTAKIFLDPDEKRLAPAKATAVCSWIEKPQMIKASGCGYSICVGQVDCKSFQGFVGCKAGSEGTSCGTAQACADDRYVNPVDPKSVTIEGDIKSKKSTTSGSAE
jgi:hypothetical protein